MNIENVSISGATFRGIITDFNLISGGTVTYYNNYTIHTITANTVLTIDSLGTVDSAIELFMVGGGGGGGAQSYAGGGGGGGGFFYKSNVILPIGQHVIEIGQGGLGHNVVTGNASTNGGDTKLAGMIALGGGKGGPGTLGTSPPANTSYFQNDLAGGNGGGAPGGRFSTDRTYLGGLATQDVATQSQSNEASTLSASGANQGGEGIGNATNTYHSAGGGAAYGYFGDYGRNVRTISAYFDGTNGYAGVGGGGWYNKNPITGSVHGEYAVTSTYPSGAYFLGGGGGGGNRTTPYSSATRGLNGIGGGGYGAIGNSLSNVLGASSGTNGYGGGGGGGVIITSGDALYNGGNGGSGCIIIKYRNS
jgi:hypothetical protein